MRAQHPAKIIARGPRVSIDGAPRRALVDFIVLSADRALLAAMQEAAQGELLLSPAATAEAAVEHLVAGRCGILLIDLMQLRGDVAALLSRVTAQFPDVVLMVAGRREDQAAVSSLITRGVIYRYVHKPLSPGRAVQFVQAALRRYRELHDREPFGLATVREMVRVQVWQRLFQHSVRVVGVAAGLVATALIVSAVRNALHEEVPPSSASATRATSTSALATPQPASSAKTVTPVPSPSRSTSGVSPTSIDAQVREAQHLVELGRLNDATRVVHAMAAIAPDDARVGIIATTIGQQLLTRTIVAIGENDLVSAQRRLDAARALDREFNLALPDLQATENALAQASASTAKSAIDAHLDIARARRAAGDLALPAGESAFDALQAARWLAPEDDDVRAESQALAFALLNAATEAVANRSFATAEALLERANQLVPHMGAVRELQHRIDEERPSADAKQGVAGDGDEAACELASPLAC